LIIYRLHDLQAKLKSVHFSPTLRKHENPQPPNARGSAINLVNDSMKQGTIGFNDYVLPTRNKN